MRTQEVNFGAIYDTEIKITPEGLKNSAAKWIPADSVIVAMYGNSAGRVAINKIELTTNQACCNLVVDPRKADFRFIYYSLLKDYETLHGLARGSAQNNLNAGDVKNYEILVPNLSTQNRIASILSAYDDLIEVNNRRIRLLEEAARQLYQEWFVRLRFPRHEQTPVHDGLPEGWQRVKVGTLLTLQRGFDLPKQDRTDGEYPIIAATGVNGCHSEAKVLGPGVVTGRSGSLGTVLYIHEDFWPLNTTLWTKEFKRVTPIYAHHLLSDLKLERFNGGAAVPTLNRNDVHDLEVVFSGENLVAKFTELLQPTYDQIKTLTLQNQKLRQARDLLLPRLMRGELLP